MKRFVWGCGLILVLGLAALVPACSRNYGVAPAGPLPVFTSTFTNSPTNTNTVNLTGTPTAAPSNTPTGTLSPSSTFTNTSTPTNTTTYSSTGTLSPSNTPTPTPTPSNTSTLTNTATPTNSPTANATACQTWTLVGDQTPVAGAVTVNGTVCQSIFLGWQPFQLNAIVVDLASANPSVSVGIYGGSLIWSSPNISMSAGKNVVWLQSPFNSGNPAGIVLTDGHYSVCVASPNPLYLAPAFNGSSNVVMAPGQLMPNPFPDNLPTFGFGQGVIYVYGNTCSAGPTQIITYTPIFSPTYTPWGSATPTATSSFTPTPTVTPTPTLGPCSCTFTPTSTLWPCYPGTCTPVDTPTFTPTFTGTVTYDCGAAAILNFTGNLDRLQPAISQPGGILQLGVDYSPILPIALSGVTMNSEDLSKGNYGPGQALFQTNVFGQYADGAAQTLPNHGEVGVVSGVPLVTAQNSGTDSYAWQSLPRQYPACSVTRPVTDSVGQIRQVTVQFYQVNDLGDAAPPVNPTPPHQVAYVWYAFETTGGMPPDNSNLLGGTGIIEGDVGGVCSPYDRGVSYTSYWGDLLYFNSDGSADSEGGVQYLSGFIRQWKPYIYLPPKGLGILVIEMNFGSAGFDGYGFRDGITGDAAPGQVF